MHAKPRQGDKGFDLSAQTPAHLASQAGLSQSPMVLETTPWALLMSTWEGVGRLLPALSRTKSEDL
jgi:hypothetical protein